MTLVACVVLVLLSSYHVLDAGGIRCCSCCVHDRSAFVLAFVAAIAATLYADFVSTKLDDVSDSAVSNPTACFVCPNGHNDYWRMLLATGAAVAWLGLIGTAFALYVSYATEDSSPKGEKLITRPIDMNDNDDENTV